jgi:hypothetical protein
MSQAQGFEDAKEGCRPLLMQPQLYVVITIVLPVGLLLARLPLYCQRATHARTDQASMRILYLELSLINDAKGLPT